MQKRFLATVLLSSALALAACGSEDRITYVVVGSDNVGGGSLTTIAGSPFQGAGFEDGAGANARFDFPDGGAYAGGFLYVIDKSNNAIRRVTIGDNVMVSTLNLVDAGSGDPVSLDQPSGIATDGTFLYVTEGGLPNVVRKISIAGNAVSNIDVAVGADRARGLATDNTYLYIADYNGNAIRRVRLSDNEAITLTIKEAGTDNEAVFNAPAALALDGNFLYVGGSSHVIRKISLVDNTVTDLAGLSGTPGSADGTGVAARFNYPKGLAVLGTNLYVADENNFTIRQVAVSTGAVTTVAGRAGLFGNDDGAPLASRFQYPRGIVAAGGALIVIDSNNNTLRKLVLP